MNAPSDLSSDRMHFVAPGPSDVDDIFERYASDPEVTRYVGFPRHRTRKDTEDFIEFSEAQWKTNGAGPYLLRARSDGTLLGSTGLALKPDKRAMIGYLLAQDSWGKGYASEALRRMVELGKELGLSELFAYCHPEHAPSFRVLEKCGFTRVSEGVEHFFPNLSDAEQRKAFAYTKKLAA